MKNTFLELSETADSIIQNKEYEDLDLCKMAVLFPFIEALGYDTTTVGDVKIAPIYTPDASYKMDYGLRGLGVDDIKVLVKIINYEADPSEEFKNIRACVLQKDEVEYVIISDCINYYIYAYDTVNNDLIEIEKFNICNFESIDFCTLEKMKKPIVEYSKQEFAFSEDDEEVNNDEEEYEGPSTQLRISTLDDEDDTVEINETKKHNPKNKKIMNIVIISSLIAVIVILCFALFGKGDSGFINIFNAGNQNLLSSYDIAAEMKLTADGNTGKLDIDFSSRDIPTGGIVKFVLTNGQNSSVLYKSVDNSGKIKTKVTIPDDWGHPEINVVAYLRFDEKQNVQPKVVTEKFGVNGEKIIQKEGAPDKFALTFAKVSWDSEAVKAYLEWMNEQKLIEERETRRKDFSQADVRYDSKGNIKVIPKGFDMNQNNITESRNIYPQIFYDASEDAAYFYLICGYVGQKWSMFRNVSFYADGYEWNYEISSNEKKQLVNGGYVTEWVYFHNFNIPTLINDADLLAKSKSSTIRFSGYAIKEHALSNSEKDMIASMLNLWDKYFNNLSVRPTTEWFIELESTSESSGSMTSNPYIEDESEMQIEVSEKDKNGIKKGNYSLSYIYVPEKLKERHKSEEIALNDLAKKIQDIRAKGQKVSKDEQEKYELERSKFRVINDNLKYKLFDYMKTYGGNLTYYQDYENSTMDYYKLYLDYNEDEKGSIEMGYIPYLYVMENKKVYMPIQTDANSLNNKSYVTLELTEDLFNELVEVVKSTKYE